MRWVVLVLLLMTSVAVADDRAVFRKQNTQHFTVLDVDRAGHIRHVRTDDPDLMKDELEVRGWLQLNADLFGGRAEDNERRSDAGVLAYYLLDPDQGQATGAAIVRKVHGELDITIVRPTRSPDAAAKALVGTRHIQTLHYGTVPQRDCAMGGVPSACKTHVTSTRRRTVTLTADEVGAALQLRVIRGAVRFVVCVTAEAPTPDEDPSPLRETSLIDTTLSGVPFAIDAATGARVAVSSCVPEI